MKLRKKQGIKIIGLLGLLAVVAVVVGYYAYLHRSYSDYRLVSGTEREDSAGTSFLSLQDGILKYSNDGATYLSEDGTLVWDQAYEMLSPVVDVCGEYAVIGQGDGTQIYIFDTSGLCTRITTNHAIYQVHVAAQGTIAVWMQEEDTGYLQLYDKSGTLLAEGQLHLENGSFPLDMALSSDGTKLAIAALDVSDGTIASTVTFYNFGSVGQNEIDNIVATFTYEDTLIAKVIFQKDSRIVAVGDNQLIFYQGSQVPEEKAVVTLEKEILSICQNEEYLCLVTSATEEDALYEVTVYSAAGAQKSTFSTDFLYESLYFLEGNQICFTQGANCRIYTLAGGLRFSCEFEEEIEAVLHRKNLSYTVLLKQTTEEIKLK